MKKLVLWLALAGCALAAQGKDYRIGVYYFPGWKNLQPGAPAPLPWERIKAYPEREPLLGWYAEGEVAIAEQQLQWMHDYGIDFVLYDWYWTGKETYLEHGLKAYFAARNRSLVPFALLWANHYEVPRTLEQFQGMVRYWLRHYFPRPEYLRFDGKPVVVVFLHDDFIKQAERIGMAPDALLKDAERMAREAGFPGIYFVGGTHIDGRVVNQRAATSGYSAFSAYNYHGRAAGKESTSYAELDDTYRYLWRWITDNSPLPYFLPMISGWDKRPWGGSKNPAHDNSMSTPDEFERHLRAARDFMDRNPEKTLRTGVICCWNEFGEGSYIEPTKKDGFTYLERVRKVFGTNAGSGTSSGK